MPVVGAAAWGPPVAARPPLGAITVNLCTVPGIAGPVGPPGWSMWVATGAAMANALAAGDSAETTRSQGAPRLSSAFMVATASAWNSATSTSRVAGL